MPGDPLAVRGPLPQIRLGIDVVSISRLEHRLRDWPKLAGRIFLPGELAFAEARPYPAQHLAARLAAKEATFKALESGWPMVSWLDVEVVSEGSCPSLKLSGEAQVRAGRSSAIVSFSHDAGIAVAQVMLLDQAGDDGPGD